MGTNNMTVIFMEDERELVLKALKAFADELRHISDTVATRYLSQCFAEDATRATALADKIRSSVTKDEMDRQVMNFMRTGEKINAIRLVRQQTNMGLKEAKEYVEALERGIATWS